MEDKKKRTYEAELPGDVQRLLGKLSEETPKEKPHAGKQPVKRAEVGEDVIQRLIKGVQKK